MPVQNSEHLLKSQAMKSRTSKVHKFTPSANESKFNCLKFNCAWALMVANWSTARNLGTLSGIAKYGEAVAPVPFPVLDMHKLEIPAPPFSFQVVQQPTCWLSV